MMAVAGTIRICCHGVLAAGYSQGDGCLECWQGRYSQLSVALDNGGREQQESAVLGLLAAENIPKRGLFGPR